MWSGAHLGTQHMRWGKVNIQWGIENDYIVSSSKKDKWKVYIKAITKFGRHKNKKRQRFNSSLEAID